MGFKNARKATSYAAEAAAEKLAVDARRMGFGQVHRAPVLVMLGLHFQAFGDHTTAFDCNQAPCLNSVS